MIDTLLVSTNTHSGVVKIESSIFASPKFHTLRHGVGFTIFVSFLTENGRSRSTAEMGISPQKVVGPDVRHLRS